MATHECGGNHSAETISFTSTRRRPVSAQNSAVMEFFPFRRCTISGFRTNIFSFSSASGSRAIATLIERQMCWQRVIIPARCDVGTRMPLFRRDRCTDHFWIYQPEVLYGFCHAGRRQSQESSLGSCCAFSNNGTCWVSFSFNAIITDHPARGRRRAESEGNCPQASI